MANDIDIQTLVDGPVNAVLKVQISGDNSGDETVALIVNVSALSSWRNQVCDEVSIRKVKSTLNAFSAQLIWDASANIQALDIPVDMYNADFTDMGGLINETTTGKTGDILLATTGLATEEGTITLYLRKKYAG